MIITDKLVYIHFPKAGGTFVTKILEQLYDGKIIPAYERQNTLKKLVSKKPYYIDYRVHDTFEGVVDERHNHNGYSQIPPEHLTKPIFTTIRNPFDFYVSYYETKKWINERTLNDSELLALLPSFPDLDFPDFLKFLDFYYTQKIFKTITGQNPIKGIGLYTLLFILLYSKEPLEVYSKMGKQDYIVTEDFMIGEEITFLAYGELNNELHSYLQNFYSKEDINFLYEAKKENVSPNRKSPDWKGYYTENTHDLISKSDLVGLNFFYKLVKK
jgi:hypothetical protein